MQRKLKSMFRKSIGKEPGPSQRAHESKRLSKSSLPYVEDQRRGDSESTRASRASQHPSHDHSISSTYGSPGKSIAPAIQSSGIDNDGDSTQPNHDLRAKDATMGGLQRSMNGGSGGNLEEAVEHNDGSFGPGQTRPQQIPPDFVNIDHQNHEGIPRGLSGDDESFSSAAGSVSSSNYSEPHRHTKGSRQHEQPRTIVHRDPEMDRTQSKMLALNPKVLGKPPGEHIVGDGPVKFQSATKGGHSSAEDEEFQKQLRLDGVVDLTDTVDTDGDITWAPAITHEIIKPHRHEILQEKIFREVHNYEYFHRIQPVMMTEVLPPRHWIPNPGGEGLIEISADELPARTGENRWWSVIQHESPYSAQKTQIKWRTEPEIIERATTITAEGFERKETIIIHPPTLADLRDYSGLVQPVHFDHKTGRRWMGEMSTMEELHDLQKLLDSAPEAHAFQLKGLADNLPEASSNDMPKRKSVPGGHGV